ncbi:MAG: NosD domain-containing protein [Candidatus Bathyarchaeia archaeon]
MRKIVTVIFFTFMETLVLVQFVDATDSLATIIIRPDGSIDPPTAPISRTGATYTFTGEVYAEIVVQKNNIIIDGRNFALQGGYILNSTGILLSNVKEVTIKNMHIKGFFYAIKIESSTNCIITDNIITSNDFGVWVEHATENIIAKNIFSGLWCGAALKYSSKNQFSENTFSNNKHGIVLDWSSENILTKNNLTDNSSSISLAWSNNNSVGENFITGRSKGNWYGIKLHSSSNNIIHENSVENTFYAISLLYDTTRNLITRNNISRNAYGIKIWYATNNTIYHNRFIDNTEQAKGYSFQNKWDNDYPEGGNYWSNYAGIDEKKGRNQDQPGSDGIGDTPYFIDDKNVDYYPLMGSLLKQDSNQTPIVFYFLTIVILTGLGAFFFILRRTKIATAHLKDASPK